MTGPRAPYGLALALALTLTGRAYAEPARVLEQVALVERASPTSELFPLDEVAGLTGRTVAEPSEAFVPELDTKWRGLSSNCSYLPPKGDFVSTDGTYDVIVHFHAGMMSEKQFRDARLGAVFVACGFGIGSGGYADAFSDTGRFGRMLDGLSKDIGVLTHRRDVKPGHIGLASWSAGFAAVGKILGVSRYYDRIDTVVLMDSLHSRYKEPNPKTAAQGIDRVDVTLMEPFVKFAREAASGSGKKTMVMSHSSIIPPDYPSAAEATGALLGAIGVTLTPVDETNGRGMNMYYRADAGSLHVRGFRGKGPKDHFAHLYLVGEHLRSWVVPQWKLRSSLAYTVGGEQR